MKCQEYQERVCEFLDGALAPAEAAAFEAHTAACPECRQELEMMRQTLDSLDAWPELEPGPTFVARVWERIREEPVRQPSLWELVVHWMAGHRSMMSLATLVVLLGAALVLVPPVLQGRQEVEVAYSEILPADSALGQVEVLPEVPDLELALLDWDATDDPSLPGVGEMNDPLLDQAEQILETL
ncbi:MAG: zf-HC2 domain-containing protein [Candidatus Eremiobacterota bacterium]